MNHITPLPFVTADKPLDAALAIWQAGYDTIPFVPGGKKPVKGWKDPKRRAAGEAEVAATFAKPRNVALRLGAAGRLGDGQRADGPRRLVDVDLDWPEAAALAPAFLPASGFAFGYGDADSHRLYAVTGNAAVSRAAAAFKLPADVHLPGGGHGSPVELPSLHLDGRNVRLPPSSDGSGASERLLQWADGADGVPAEVEAVKLFEDVRRLAIAAVLARLWARLPGQHHALALAVAPVLLRPEVLDVAAVEHIVRHAALARWRRRSGRPRAGSAGHRQHDPHDGARHRLHGTGGLDRRWSGGVVEVLGITHCVFRRPREV